MATCNTKIGKDGNISRVHCQNLEGCKGATFLRHKKKKVYYFLFILPKVAPLHPEFSLSTFLQIKAIKLPPHPPLTRIQQKFAKIIRGLSKGANYKCHSFTSFVLHAETCTFIFVLGGKGGMLGLSLAACASLGMQEVAFLDLLLFLGKGNNLP